MAKPSIFSSNYDRQMKKRKKRKRKISLLVVVLIFGTIVGIYAIGFSDFSSKAIDGINTLGSKLISNKDKTDDKDIKKAEEKAEEVISEEESEEEEAATDVVEETKTKDIPVSVNNQIGAIITVDKVTNKITAVKPNNENTQYQLSDTRNSGLLYDKTAQMVFVFNNLGEVKDITYKKYIATNGDVSTREEVIAYRSDFVWMGTPKFIDDNTVIYKSFLPWFTSVNYIWVYNISANEYKTVWVNSRLLGGGTVEILDKVDDGIKITVDGTAYKVTPNAIARLM